MKVLHIGDNDLISRRFNGYDYHDALKEHGVTSNNLVVQKLSESDYVYVIDKSDSNFTLSIIKNKIFLESDIIHFHLIHNIPFDLNYLPIITQLKPVVITLHDPFFLGGHCIHHFICTKWKVHCYDCQYLDIPFAIKVDDMALQFAIKKLAIDNSDISAIVASEWMENKVKQSPIWQQKKIYRLPFGINQEIFKPVDMQKAKKRLDINEDSVTLFFRTDNGQYKGLALLKESLQKIRSNKKITLLTVGMSNILTDLEDKYSIKEFGWVNDDNLLVQLYQACDLFLMPSEQEAFGLMAVEAMSCGKMVLTTNNTALETVTNSPACGISVEYNTESYANELQRLLDNPDEITERGRKSLAFSKDNYNQDVFIINLIKIYDEIINNHKETSDDKLIITQLKKYNNDYIPAMAESNTLYENKTKDKRFYNLLRKLKSKIRKILYRGIKK